MSDEHDKLRSLIEDRLRISGNRVVLVIPDKELESVGEECLIATHGVLDRKTFGRVCLERVFRILLRTRADCAAPALHSDNPQPAS